MKIISRIESVAELAGNGSIPHSLVKVDNSIKDAAGSDKRVDTLSGSLSKGIRIRLDRSESGRGRERRDGRSKERNAERVDASGDLLVRLDKLITNGLLSGDGGSSSADIVHTLKDHGIVDAGLCEYVTVDATKSVGTIAIGQYAVSNCCLVMHGDIRVNNTLLHSRENEVGPSRRQ